LWKGLLKIAFTNHDTGTTVTKNVNGRSLSEYFPDGTFKSITVLSGHFTTSIAPGNEMPPGRLLRHREGHAHDGEPRRHKDAGAWQERAG